MTGTEHHMLRAASRQEVGLYEGLLALYHELRAALADAERSVDPTWLAAQQERVDETIRALRALSARLAPHRLTAAEVPPEIHALWRRAATIAAEAAQLNSELAARVRARQSAILARLVRLDVGRQGLVAYRPVPSAHAAAGTQA